MKSHHLVLSIPGLRRTDLEYLPALRKIFPRANPSELRHSFPCVTWPAQATLLTGALPSEHGVIANGFYWREERRVEMWTAWNNVIERPQVWDLLKQRDPHSVTAAWFPMLSKGAGADHLCMPAPIHKPDGSEELWCYTRPQDFYGELLDKLGHFPLQHFWGPLANIRSSQWIADSAVLAARGFRPNFFFVYIPHLDYAAQKFGPNSPQATQALAELDALLNKMADEMQAAYEPAPLDWTVVSEYVIRDVSHVSFPNRLLRMAGLLKVRSEPDGEYLDLENSQAWALVDHQFSHVFVQDHNPSIIQKVQELFRKETGFAQCLTGEQLNAVGLNHRRSGDCVLISSPDSWQAYYWWTNDARAPTFARTVDIHRKPGYDPVELFFDPKSKSIPLQADLVKGSHGVVVTGENQGVIVSTCPVPEMMRDVEFKDWILKALC